MLKEIRESHGWTLEETSARLKKVGMICTASQLEKIEKQERGISDYEILYFAAALEITPDDLRERLDEIMARHFKAKKKR